MTENNHSTFKLRKGIWADARDPMLFESIGITDCKSILNGGGI